METPLETSRLIFDNLYMCRVPVLATRSEADIKAFGIVRTGIKDIDDNALGDWVTVMWSINTMAEKFKRGYSIKVIKEADSRTIYEHITRHLQAWQMQLDSRLNGTRAPFDDLILLDKLANVIYPHVKYELHKAPPPIESLMDSYLKEKDFVNKQSFANIFSNPIKETRNNNYRSKIPDIKDREGFDDYFKDKFISDGDFSLNKPKI